MKRLSIIVPILLLLGFAITNAQIKNKMTVEVGFLPFKPLGTNATTSGLITENDDATYSLGAGLRNNQLGFSFSLNMSVTDDDLFVVPFGFNIINTHAIQYESTFLRVSRYEHENTLTQIRAGLQYQPVRFVNNKVKAYIGFDAVMTLVGQGREIVSELDSRGKVKAVQTTDSKVGATRFGPAFKLGFNAEMTERWGINTFIQYGMLNLIGRNDERGELLTPRSELMSYQDLDVVVARETEENIVHSLIVAFSITYRL